ncbi:MAG: hypothetical protein Q8S84_01390, partial [bacterium]|nr:hypothetical protein [bacterium]
LKREEFKGIHTGRANRCNYNISDFVNNSVYKPSRLLNECKRLNKSFRLIEHENIFGTVSIRCRELS